MLRVLCVLAVAVFGALPASAEKRVALIIGNSAYQQAGTLANPVNDAKEMATALKDLGFVVLLGLDLDKRAFDIKVRDFSRALADADTGVFFYAGHGLQIAGRNYLIPIDAQLQRERDVDFEAVGLEFILKQMELEREGKTNIVFLDACRDNPLARNLARSMGTRSASVGQGWRRCRPASARSSPTRPSLATSRSTATGAIRRSPRRWRKACASPGAISLRS